MLALKLELTWGLLNDFWIQRLVDSSIRSLPLPVLY